MGRNNPGGSLRRKPLPPQFDSIPIRPYNAPNHCVRR